MNNVTLTGRLGKDAEVKQHGERYLITFSIATSEKRRDGERTDWHNVKYWTSSDKVAQCLTKGTQVAVSGAYRNDQHEGKYFYFVDAYRVELLGSKTDNTNNANDNDGLPF